MINSPCTRNCCLDTDDVCVGCFRHIDEICGWQSMSESAKEIVLNNCQKRKIAHTKNKGYDRKQED